jgi:hypothetical protein
MVTDDGSPVEDDSETISISVGNFNRPPELLSPPDGQTGEILTLTLLTTGGVWDEGFSDLEGHQHLQTQWQISKESDFSSLGLDITSDIHLYSLTVPESVLVEGTIYYWRVRYFSDNNTASDWSEAWSFTTEATLNDQNDNGIPDGQEVNGTIDLNGDGTPDIDQPHVIKCVETVYGNGQMGIVPVQNVDSIESLKAIDPDAIGNKPGAMPLGLISFKLRLIDPNNPVAKVDIYTSSPLAKEEWHRYDAISGWQDYSAHAEFNGDLTVVRLTFEDGGFGDADGTKNAVIVDPSGPGPLASTPPPQGGDSGGGGGGCFISTATHEPF